MDQYKIMGTWLGIIFFAISMTTGFAAEIPAGSLIISNVAYQGTISTVGEKDYFSFNVEPNIRYYIVVWADNTFGNYPGGLTDTEIRAYYTTPSGDVTALSNTDGPTWANLGFGSMAVIEAIPAGIESSKKSHCLAPSTVTFYVAHQDMSPDTGSYTFKVFTDSVPQLTTGGYNYDSGSSTYMFTGPVNPPRVSEVQIAPGEKGNPATPTSIIQPQPTTTTDPDALTQPDPFSATPSNPLPTTTSQPTQTSHADLPTCAQLIQPNIAYQASISAVGERDWYKISVAPNKRYYIIVWADDTFGNNPAGLRDTELRSYFYQDVGQSRITAMGNTDGPTWANLGFGSMIVMEAVPSNVAPTKKSQVVAPSEVTFFIAQQDFEPETGTYTFKIFVDDIPTAASGGYDYDAGSSTYMFTAAINPPAVGSTMQAPGGCETIEGESYNSNPTNPTNPTTPTTPDPVEEPRISVYPTSGAAPLTVMLTTSGTMGNMPVGCVFDYGDGTQLTSDTRHTYTTGGAFTIQATNCLIDSEYQYSNSVTATVTDVKTVPLQLMAIDKADELNLIGNSGIDVKVWLTQGDSGGNVVEQFIVFSINNQWYYLDNTNRWNQVANMQNLLSELQPWASAALSAPLILFRFPDYIWPAGTMDCFYLIDSVLDGHFTPENASYDFVRINKR